MRVLRYIWALFPNTLLGLALALLAIGTGGCAAVVGGVIEAHGGAVTPLLRRRRIRAITLGHVVLGRHSQALDDTRQHERVHVRQYERWGPLFLAAYGLSSLVAWLRKRDPYLDNFLEREAFDHCVSRSHGCQGELEIPAPPEHAEV